MKKNEKKLVRIDLLKNGERFEIPSLSETMRKMRLISVSDCSSLIEGQKRDASNEEWKPFRFHIANSVMVQINNTDSLAENSETPQSSVKDTPIRNRRGRPSKQKPDIGSLKGVNAEFTKKQLAELNGIKEYEAHQIVAEAVKKNKAKEVKQVKSGRGKPTKVYRLI